MEVIIMESEAFKELKSMFEESQQTIKQQAAIITNSKIAMMSAKQVAELTGYDEKTIKVRKEEIGYHTMGRDVKFKPADVEAWIDRYYRGPKNKKTGRSPHRPA